MPIYEYECEACGADKEAIQKMSADPLKTCDACGEDTLRRKISRTSFVLKGSGWYVTDYKKSGSTSPSSDGASSSDSKSTSSGSDSSSSDSSSSSASSAD